MLTCLETKSLMDDSGKKVAQSILASFHMATTFCWPTLASNILSTASTYKPEGLQGSPSLILAAVSASMFMVNSLFSRRGAGKNKQNVRRQVMGGRRLKKGLCLRQFQRSTERMNGAEVNVRRDERRFVSGLTPSASSRKTNGNTDRTGDNERETYR